LRAFGRDRVLFFVACHPKDLLAECEDERKTNQPPAERE
jgi:hypothetical protein